MARSLQLTTRPQRCWPRPVRAWRPWRCRARLPRTAPTWARLIGTEGYFHVGALMDDESLPIDEDVRPRIWLGRGVSAADYLALLRSRENDKRAAMAAMEGFDALLTPGTLTAAPAVDAIDQNKTPAHFTRPRQLAGMVCPGGAQRCHRGRASDVAAHHLPRPRRDDGAPHRLGLRAGHRLAPARAPRPGGVASPLHPSRRGVTCGNACTYRRRPACRISGITFSPKYFSSSW